jgi:hypothetical protein
MEGERCRHTFPAMCPLHCARKSYSEGPPPSPPPPLALLLPTCARLNTTLVPWVHIANFQTAETDDSKWERIEDFKEILPSPKRQADSSSQDGKTNAHADWSTGAAITSGSTTSSTRMPSTTQPSGAAGTTETSAPSWMQPASR